MQRVFVHTSIFSRKVDSRGGDELVQTIEGEILKNPAAGDLVPGIGGIRKLRVGDESRGGKRGGYRVLYLDVPHRKMTYLLYFYGKDEAEDISVQEKKSFRELAGILKGEDNG
jgi:hypothetical protein